MSDKDFVAGRSYRTLLTIDGGSAEPSSSAVYIHHGDLDHLIGRLMQMCDLIGDVEQRSALKSTIKQINREWLDSLYEESGYGRFDGLKKNVEPVVIPRYKPVELK